MDTPTDIFDHTVVPTVTSANFEQEVLKSDKPVMVEFFARWCEVCQGTVPEMDKLEQARTDVKIVKVDVDASLDLREKYHISGMPTMVMIRKGDMIARLPGSGTAAEMGGWVDQSLTLPADFKLVIKPVKLTDDQKKTLRAVFEAAANKNPDADKPYTFNGVTTTLRQSLEKDLDSGVVAKQFENIMTENGAKLDDLLNSVRQQGVKIPPGAKF
jgi:thioredoxin 1